MEMFLGVVFSIVAFLITMLFVFSFYLIQKRRDKKSKGYREAVPVFKKSKGKVKDSLKDFDETIKKVKAENCKANSDIFKLEIALSEFLKTMSKNEAEAKVEANKSLILNCLTIQELDKFLKGNIS